ncbi:MAG TPA: tetratricopeptide repeat protein [Anaerolineales bacterium]|nr:tetratricopeptide repeat protein [Anaerolineales bacterium]
MLFSSGLPISRIKIRIPHRRRELITRARLIDGIYEQLEKRLLLIVAPAGYGKTSLLIDLAQQSELPVCWLSLDTLDQEPQRFLGYLIAAVAEKFPSFGRDSLAALESMASIEQDEERLLVAITNEINAQINEHFILILDDYHLVSSVAFINHAISRFLQLTGEHVHLILSTRNLPNLPDAPLMIARNQVGGLSFEELSFYPEEIQQLFQQNNGILLSREDAQTLVQETEGWIAAIHLTNGNPGTLPQMHPLESTRELFDFFSKEVLLRQSEQVRRFMLMTSVFDTFDVSLCGRVLKPLMEEKHFDWPTLFETVRTGNLFSVTLDSEGHWMRYHHLFQHFLRSQLQYEEPVLAWHIEQNLARAYEEQEAWEEALEVYARLDDHENQVRLLMNVGLNFIRAGRALTLANWLDRLPSEDVYSHPALVSLLGIIHTTRGEIRQSLELFNLAEASFRESGNKVEWTTTLVRLAESYRQLGQFDRALEDLDKVFELTQDVSLPAMQHTFAEAQRVKGLVLFGLGHVKEALVWLQDALQACRVLGIKENIPVLEIELGVVYRRLGKPEVTGQYYASALQALENTGNTGWKARLLNNLGLLYHLTGRLEESYPLLQDALVTSERSGYIRIKTNVLISLGDLLTDLSDYVSAYSYYDHALTLATNLGHSLYIFYASLGQARLQRLKGDHLLAVEELRRAELSQVNLGIFEKAIFNLELGCCWLDGNKLELAIDVLREAVALLGQGGNQTEQAVTQLWLEVALSVQDPAGAADRLKALLPARRDWQKPTPQMIHAGRAARWLRKQGSSLLKDPVLKSFFEQSEHIQESLPALCRKLMNINEDVQIVAPRLEITSFGDVVVQHNQRVVELSDWQTREARDLFLFLLQSPALTKEQIAVVFWPDISPARLKVRFKINIYRIRQALGQDVILFEGDRYRFNRTINYAWDREEFDKLFEKFRQITVLSEKRKLLEQAVAILKGDYLADLNADWMVLDRLRYQEIYRYAMLELATIYLQEGQAHDCLNIARRVLLSDPLLESAHRLIIQAYASLHDPANMTLQYRQYRQTLENELGLEPSLEISTLYQQLMAAI